MPKELAGGLGRQGFEPYLLTGIHNFGMSPAVAAERSDLHVPPCQTIYSGHGLDTALHLIGTCGTLRCFRLKPPDTPRAAEQLRDKLRPSGSHCLGTKLGWTDMPALGIMFHHFHDGFHVKGQGAISALDLEELIVGHGPENILSARDWMTGALNGTLEENQCCLTFDDGLRCQFDIALPVLERHGLTAFWFIYTSIHAGTMERFEIYRYFRTVAFDNINDFYDAFDKAVLASRYADEVSSALERLDPNDYKSELNFYSTRDRTFRQIRDDVLGAERYREIMDAMLEDAGGFDETLASVLWMTSSQIKTLHENGHVIGLHSHTHPMRIDRLSKQQQYIEYSKNMDVLQDIIGTRPASMAHPNNAYNGETLSVLSELGVRLGFSARPNKDIRNFLELPRQDHGTFLRNLRTRRTCSGIRLGEDEIATTVGPYVVERLPANDPRWRNGVDVLLKRWRRRWWRRRLFGWLPTDSNIPRVLRGRRSKRYVRQSYEELWDAREWPETNSTPPRKHLTHAEWNSEGLMIRRGGLARLHLVLIARTIEALRPRSVLEVGCGVGLNLFVMSARFPEIDWSGIELTENGVSRAKAVQRGEALPPSLVEYCPWPVSDEKAFTRIDFRQGDAARLPFEDSSFDLVFTRQSLEQMDLIRHAAFSEIARVARSYVIMVEPFVDFNRDRLRHDYTRAKDLLSFSVENLKQFGIEPLAVYDGFPMNITLGLGHVVGRIVERKGQTVGSSSGHA